MHRLPHQERQLVSILAGSRDSHSALQRGVGGEEVIEKSDTFRPRLVERLSSFSIKCAYKSTLGLSFVGRFAPFWSVLYQEVAL